MESARRPLAAVVTVAWALWLGGLMTLFLAVVTIFRTLAPGGRSAPPEQRRTAGTVASALFHAFDRYQLILAAAALVTVFAWRLAGGAPRLKTGLFGILALAATLAVTSTMYVTPQVEALRQQGITAGRQFDQLHGLSSALYTAEAAILVAGGLLLPSILVRDHGTGLAQAEARNPKHEIPNNL